ncbi:MAG: hypothetical protein LUQ31_08065 [Methanoregula sp.]|nr:hypothetical protein [Methanoregula sp.]
MTNLPDIIASVTVVILGVMLSLPLSPSWIVLVPVALLFIASRFVRISGDQSFLVRVFSGVPFVVVLATLSFWGGVIILCGIIGIVLLGEEKILSKDSYALIIPVLILVIILGAIIDASNHMLLPVVILTACAFVFTGLFGVMVYREKRAYRCSS